MHQVASLSKLASGAFYLDEAASKLYLGTDPTRNSVVASNLFYGLNVRAAGAVVRGIGIRRYAPSVWHMAGVTIEQSAVVLENVVISEMATTGLSVLNRDVRLDHVTVQRNGLLGIHGRFADNLTMQQVDASFNNSELFRIEGPVPAGVKLGATRGVRVYDSNFHDNWGQGFWEDMSVYDSVFSGNNFSRNFVTGLFLEISARAIVVNSLILDNHHDGLKINNTSNVQVWNNTIVGNARAVWLAQDARRNINPSDQAVDTRRPFPDPTMPWELDNVSLSNNVFALPANGANSLLCVEDYSRKESAEQMNITTNGNIYNRASTASPSWLSIWSRGTSNPSVFTSLAAMRSATGQETRGREHSNGPVVTKTGQLAATIADVASVIALPLPVDVASAAGAPSGRATLGAFLPPSTILVPPAPGVDPVPSPGAFVVRDTFSRNTRSGWGAADAGGRWQAQAGADAFSVSSGVARLTLGAGDGYKIMLDEVKTSRADFSTYVALDRIGSGDGHFINLIGRSVAERGDYQARYRILPNGSVTVWLVRRVGTIDTVLTHGVIPGLTYSLGDTIRLRFAVMGTGTTTLRAKAWSAKGGEPSSWAVAATDSTASLQAAGSIGISAYASTTTKNAPITFFYDDLVVSTAEVAGSDRP